MGYPACWEASFCFRLLPTADVDPIASMQAVDNKEPGDVAKKVQGLLKKMIDSL